MEGIKEDATPYREKALMMGQKRKREPNRLQNVLVQVGKETFRDPLSPKAVLN